MIPPNSVSARVVLIDDEQGVRGAMRRLFERRGIQIVGEAADGASGVDVVAETRPDVAVIDVRMPVLDGLEATRHICEATPETRVVMATAFDDPSLKNECYEAGAVAYFIKGYAPQLLVDLVLTEAARARLRHS